MATRVQWHTSLPDHDAADAADAADQLLLVLLHPPTSVLDAAAHAAAPTADADADADVDADADADAAPPLPPLPSLSPSRQLLARCATRCLHRVLFADRRVCAALHAARARCVLARHPAPPPALHRVLAAAALSLPPHPPVLLLLARRRALWSTLLCRSGYVSPNTLLAALPSSASLSPSPLPSAPIPSAPSPAPAPAPASSALALRVRLPSGDARVLSFPPAAPFSRVRARVATILRAAPHHLRFTRATPPFAELCPADDRLPLADLSLAPAATLVVSLPPPPAAPAAPAAPSALRARLVAALRLLAAFVHSFFAQPPPADHPPADRRGDVRDNGNGTQFAFGADASQ